MDTGGGHLEIPVEGVWDSSVLGSHLPRLLVGGLGWPEKNLFYLTAGPQDHVMASPDFWSPGTVSRDSTTD